jgi:hypothetical protein
MKKALTRQEMEALGPWFDGRIEETEAEWEAARQGGGVRSVGSLGCSSLAEASKARGRKGGGSGSARSAAPLAAKAG